MKVPPNIRRRVLLTAIALFAAIPFPAFAHAELLSAAPAADSTVSAPTELRLEFSEELEPAFSKLVLKGSDEQELATGSVDPENATVLLLPLDEPLIDGTYTIEWTAASKDGHKTTGTLVFTATQ